LSHGVGFEGLGGEEEEEEEEENIGKVQGFPDWAVLGGLSWA
jgi:hypothetical protein